ncbi:TonB-dependent receptor [Bacteroides sp. OttesenSCG-928-D19]|nr:TonB-dependent receptor [Bacteroides sp. OttesenSCG-928-D19]
MEKFPRILFVMFFLVGASAAFAQDKSITGVVLDSYNEPVIGANVTVDGTANGTITNLDGKFSLSNVSVNANLKVSYIGYETQTIRVGSTTNFTIILKEDAQALDEVVVVGYGVQKKSDVTGAMTRVGEKDLKAMPVKDALQAMQGKAAGVDITTNQRPGQTGSIKIRGVRSISADQDPLYVVDGMILQTSGIDNINPSDIEAIDILKDASATAIYGSRGANGVILVTTKRGKSGSLSVNYAGSVTFENLYNVSENMSAAEWLDYARLAKYNMGTYASETPSYEADFATWGSVGASWANIAKGWTNNNTVWNPSLVGSYNWEDHGKQTAISTEHTLSVSGGTEKSQGYGSFGYLKQEGTQPGQKYERYTAKVNYDASPKDWFKVGTSINASWGDQDYGYNFAKSVTGAGDFYNALRGMLAWTTPFDENGDYIRNPAAGDVNIINPINELNYTVNNRQTFVVNGSFYGQLDFGEMFEPLKGLKYRIQFGPEFRYYRAGIFYNENGINGDGNNTAQYSTTQNRAWTLDNLVYYDRNFGEAHKLGLTLMQSASAYHQETGNMKATDVASTTELWYNLYSGGALSAFGTGLTEKQMASYMIRGNYSYKDKYLLTASIRWDGASQLAAGNKWASFPSMALGWRIDQEKFMQNVDFVSDLKARFGVGVTGNAAISAYATKGALMQLYYNWGASSSSPGYVSSDPSAKDPVKMANQKLSWEKTTQYNFGIDYGFLNRRINGSIDLYQTRTNDLLLSMTIPSLTGYTSTYANVGKTKGWGIDLQINTINIDTKDFTWSTNITWSKDKNEIVELANGNKEDVNNRWFVGEEIGVYYDYVYDGIWKTSEATEAEKYGRKPGQIKVKDLDNSGGIDANNDRTIVGKVRPDWSGGITNSFRYKDFEFSFFIYSRWGFTVPSGSLTLDGRYQMRKIDYWVKNVNENARYYSPGSNGEAADTYSSSMNYQDGSFIKLRNINLGYNIPPKVLKKAGINNLKVYAQLMNPFTIYSKCDFLDTDLSNYDNNSVSAGAPITTKGLVFGLNLNF